MFPPIEVETETIITSSYCNNNNSGGHEKELVFDSNQSSFSSSMRSLAAAQQSPESPKVVFITLSRRRSSVHNLVNTILGRPPDNRSASVNEFTDAASLDEIAQCMNSIGGGGGGSFKIKRFGAGGISSGSFRFSSRSPMANSCDGGVSPLLSPVVFMVEEEEVSNTEITINVFDIPYENDDYYDYEDNINDCSGCDDCDDDMIPLTTSRMVYSENSKMDKKGAMGGGEDVMIINSVDGGGDDDNNNDNDIIVNVDNNDMNDICDDDNVGGAANNNNNNVYDNYDELHSTIDEDENDEEKEDEYFTSDSTSDNNDNSACGDISSDPTRPKQN